MLLLPFAKALAQTIGIVVYVLVISLVLLVIPVGFLLDWQDLPAQIAAQWQKGALGNLLALALIALLGVAGVMVSVHLLMKTWAVFFRITRSRLYFATNQSLQFVAGLPMFSGGRQSLGRTGGKPPDVLEVGGMKFDLNHCWRVRELLNVASRNFVGTEPLPSGIAGGFTLSVPLRAWFIPSTGVLARVDLQEPNRNELVNRAARLKAALDEWRRRHRSQMPPKDLDRARRLSEELSALQVSLSQNGSDKYRTEAENRLATLEEWVRVLDIRLR